MTLHRHPLLVAAAAALLLAGCAQVSHVAHGDVTVRERVLVTVDRPWNQFERTRTDDIPTWTQDGITVDAVRFYVGLKDGALLAPTPTRPAGQKPLAFRSAMSPTELVDLFGALVARDGSSFTLKRVEAQLFAGQNGWHFEFESVRKADDVRLQGMGWLAVRNGELFAMTYTAPRLAFFARHLPAVQAIVQSARIKA